MKSSVTVRLDSHLLAEVRAVAACEGLSLNELLAGQLAKVVGERRAFESARQRALKRLDQGMDLGFKPGPRADLYER